MSKKQIKQETYKSMLGVPPFAMVPKFITEDLRINGNAHRIIVYLLGKKEDWIPQKKDIQNKLGLKRGAFETAQKQLIAAGYLNKRNYKDPKTGYNRVEYEFYWNPAQNPQYKGELPKYDVYGKGKISSAETDEANERKVNKNRGYDTNNILEKSKNVAKNAEKIGNYQDNVGDFEHDGDLFFEE